MAAGQTVELQLMAELRTRELILAKVTTATFGTVLCFAGAARMGLIGVVIANIVFAIPYFAWMVGISRRRALIRGT